MFLVDGSKDVKVNNFRSSLRFVKNLAKVFNVSLPNAHVAVVVYAQESEIIFNLTDHYSYKDVRKAISGVRFPNKKTRNAGKGLKRVKNGVLASSGRHSVPKIVIVVQNRKSDDGIDAISQEIREKGIRVFSVGIHDHIIANGQLKEIAYKPNKYYFTTTAYETMDLHSFIQDMKQSICKGERYLQLHSISLMTAPCPSERLSVECLKPKQHSYSDKRPKKRGVPTELKANMGKWCRARKKRSSMLGFLLF